MAVAFIVPIGAQRNASGGCRVSGRAQSGTTPLPGVSISVTSADGAAATTSSDVDGGYSLLLQPGTYTLSAALTGFTSLEQTLTLDAGGTCDQAVGLSLSLAPRLPPEPARAATPAGQGRATSAPGAVQGSAPTTAAGRGRGAGGTGAQTSSSFQSVDVQALAAATPSDSSSADGQESSTRLAAAAGLLDRHAGGRDRDQREHRQPRSRHDERSLRRDRPRRVRSGDRRVVGGAFGGDQGGNGGRGGPGGFGGRGGPAGRGGGPGGPGGLAGRGGGFPRRARAAAESHLRDGQLHVRRIGARQRPYQLRGDTAAPDTPYTQQSFGGTIGGPLKIPHVYDGTRRTNFVLTYNGNRGRNLFDQYATVPTAAMRAGDFSGLAAADRSGPPVAVPWQPDSRPAGSTRHQRRCSGTSRCRIFRARAATSTTRARPHRRQTPRACV